MISYQDMEFVTTDVLILGAGAAGIRAAWAAAEAGVKVTLVATQKVSRAGSTFSNVSKGWGVQTLTPEERNKDNLETFFKDILHVGLGCCDPELTQILVEESGPRVEELMAFGLQFKKGPDGKYLRFKGCFSEHERALITADFANLCQTFLSILRRSALILTGYAIELIIMDNTCWGAWIVSPEGKMIRLNAKATILATGGGASIFKEHLVDENTKGDGYALAYRAGAELVNMEFIQFMLGLKSESNRCFLPLSELANPGMLLDADGRDLLADKLPYADFRAQTIAHRQKHMPFSCRDISVNIDTIISQSQANNFEVYWGKKATHSEPLRVTHFAHAFNGGIKINAQAESTLQGLYAAGEVAAGPHGADRIGGCMMTATQVFGARAGKYAAKRAGKVKIPPIEQNCPLPFPFQKDIKGNAYESEILSSINQRVKTAMQRHASIARSEKGLKQCVEELKVCKEMLLQEPYRRCCSTIEFWKIRNMILTAEIVVHSALSRQESKGPHLRLDTMAEHLLHPQDVKSQVA